MREVPKKFTNSGFDLWGWLRTLGEVYGREYLFAVFCFQHLLKGFVVVYMYTSMDFVFRGYRVPAPRLQTLRSLVFMPWALKPVLGIVSDTCPVLGYRKTPYLCAFVLLGTSAFTAVGFYSFALSLESTVAAMFAMSMQIAACDLLTEATTAERLRKHPEHGPSMMSFVVGGNTLGSIVATSTIGWVLERYGPFGPYAMCTLPSAFVLLPALANCIGEQPQTPESTRERRRFFASQCEVLALVGAVGVGSLLLAGIGSSTLEVGTRFLVVTLVTLGLIGAFTGFLNPTIGCMNAFFFLQSTSTISIDGGTFYFFTDGDESFPLGPHFSVWFYTTGLGVASSVCGLLGLWIYSHLMTGWRYRGLFVVSNLCWCVVSAASVLVFTRQNLLLGIPDRAFMLGGTVLQNVFEQWAYVPGGVLLSQVCPTGMEATMFALLAGCQNLGRAAAGYFGSFMLAYLEVSPDGTARDKTQFRKLWEAAVLQALAPLVTLWMVPTMIPDASQTERIVGDDDEAAVSCSPWRRLRGGHPRGGDVAVAAQGYGSLDPSPPSAQDHC